MKCTLQSVSVLLLSLATCSRGGLFLSPSAMVDNPLICSSACEAKRMVGGCCDTPFIKLLICSVIRGIDYHNFLCLRTVLIISIEPHPTLNPERSLSSSSISAYASTSSCLFTVSAVVCPMISS